MRQRHAQSIKRHRLGDIAEVDEENENKSIDSLSEVVVVPAKVEVPKRELSNNLALTPTRSRRLEKEEKKVVVRKMTFKTLSTWVEMWRDFL